MRSADSDFSRADRGPESFLLELNAWDDIRPWTDARTNDLLVTDSLRLPVPDQVRSMLPSLRLPSDHAGHMLSAGSPHVRFPCD